MVYLLLRALLRHALAVFFRRVEVEGKDDVPTEGPLLLAANHPNTLMDVLLVATMLRRRVQFVGKATLFQVPVFGSFLRFLGAVPVSRRSDGPMDEATRKKNDAALEACEVAVATGGAVLIFPEGVSQQDEPRLQQLKTGLARVALGAERRAPGKVSIVPVGLVYDDPGTFRSRARVSYGHPIRVADFAALPPGPDGFGPARALTDAVRDALIPGVVHIDRDEDAPLVRDLTDIYGRAAGAEAGGRLAAPAAIARAVSSFTKQEPARVERVRALLADYRAALDRAGVDDGVVRALEVRRPTFAADLGFVLGAPIALWGVANHLVLYQLPRLALRLLPTDREFWSSAKLTVGLLGFFATYALQGWLVADRLGPSWAALYLGTLPLAGVIALMWLEARDERAAVRSARRRRARLDPLTRADLEQRRAVLIDDLDRARVAYLAQQPADEGPEAAPGAPA